MVCGQNGVMMERGPNWTVWTESRFVRLPVLIISGIVTGMDTARGMNKARGQRGLRFVRGGLGLWDGGLKVVDADGLEEADETQPERGARHIVGGIGFVVVKPPDG